jgi:hypothetical protein
MKFFLDAVETQKAEEFMAKQRKERPADTGAVGGRFVFEFCPTGIAVFATVVDQITKERCDLTDLDYL